MFYLNYNRYPYLLACIVSSILTVLVAIWGYAEILTITPKHNIKQWENLQEKSDIAFNQKNAESTRNRLQKAISLNRNNAEFYMSLAQLNVLQADLTALSKQEKISYQNQAIDNFKLAISKRPSWGLAWAKLAQAYANEPKQSSEFIQALERALYFEPYEKLSQQHIIPLAIAQWGTLPDSIKKRTKATIQHALRYQSNIIHLITNTTITYDWEDELAPLLTRKSHKNVLSKAMHKKKQNIDKAKFD